MPHPAEQDAARSLSNVADSALALVKAELRLMLMQNKRLALKLALSAALALLGLVATQVCVLLIAATPLLLDQHPWWAVVTSIALAALPASVCFWAARKNFRSAERQ